MRVHGDGTLTFDRSANQIEISYIGSLSIFFGTAAPGQVLISRLIGKVPRSTRRRIKGSNRVNVLLHFSGIRTGKSFSRKRHETLQGEVLLHFAGPVLTVGATIVDDHAHHDCAATAPDVYSSDLGIFWEICSNARRSCRSSV